MEHAVIDLCAEEQEDDAKIPANPSPGGSPLFSRVVDLTDVNNFPNATTNLSRRHRRRLGQNSGIRIASAEPTPVQRVLEIFPDVRIDHAESLLRRNKMDVATVTSILLAGYPKMTLFDLSDAKNNHCSGGTFAKDPAKKRYKYDFMLASSFAPSESYIQQAVCQLVSDYPFLSNYGASKVLHRASNHYAIAHDNIFNAITGRNERSKDPTADGRSGQDKETHYHDLFKKAFEENKLNSQQLSRLGVRRKDTYKFTRRKKAPSSGVIGSSVVDVDVVNDSILQEEIQYVARKQSEWIRGVQTRLQRKNARSESKKNGTAVECSCCFEGVAFEEMVACRDEGHLFCVDCLKSYAESQIFSSGNLGVDRDSGQPSMELRCFHGDGCSSGFIRSHLEKALPKKVLEKYDELQSQIALEKAGLSNVCSCPKCGFKAVLANTQMIFQCPVEDCKYESCRNCGKPPHIPLRCSEVEAEKYKTSGRLRVEEAITAALIRKCPRCSKVFVKSDGCNKITCGCGAKICYVCQQEISDYSHFCQTPHCQHQSCGKCPLYTKDEEIDKEAMRNAAVKEATKVQEEAANALSKRQMDAINIDVDTILQVPSFAKKPKKRHRIRR